MPSGAPVGAGATVAVSVTAAPAAAGFGETTSVVAVLVPEVIVSTNTLDVDVKNPALPEYTAVMLCAPTARLLVVNVATPEPSGVTVPSSVPRPHEPPP